MVKYICMIIRNGSPRNIAIHHSAVKSSAGNLAELKQRAASYDNYHKDKSIVWNNTTNGENGYKYIRYHYLVARDGSYLKTQNEKYVLYHSSDGATGEFNYWGIAICFDGNFEEEKPTEAMMRTAVKLIRDFEKRYGVDPKVRGHKEVADSSAPTACPGRNLGTSKSGWIKQLIDNVNNPNYSVEPPAPPAPPAPPSDPTTVYKERISELEAEIQKLNEQLIMRQKTIEELEKKIEEQIVSSAKKIDELQGKYDTKVKDYDLMAVEKNRFENLYNQTKEELAKAKELKGISSLDLLKEVFNRILNLFKSTQKNE